MILIIMTIIIVNITIVIMISIRFEIINDIIIGKIRLFYY